MNDAQTARDNGWTVGTRLIGDAGQGDTIIEITAVGETHVLAKAVAGDSAQASAGNRESMWTFAWRNWKVCA